MDFYFTTQHLLVAVTISVGKVNGILPGIDEPGTVMKSPLTTSYDMYTEVQTDCIQNVECGTTDGPIFIIPSVCILNKLPKERAREVFEKYGPDYDQITIFQNGRSIVQERCTEGLQEDIYFKEWSQFDGYIKEDLIAYQKEKDTGIIIEKVRIDSKPIAKGSDIVTNFKMRAEHVAKTKTLIEEAKKIEQANLNAMKISEGENKIAYSKNEAKLDRELQNKEYDKKKQKIELQMIKLKATAEAENIMIKGKAKSDVIKLEANANKELLTQPYLQKIQAESMLKNSKLIIGNQIPKMMFYLV